MIEVVPLPFFETLWQVGSLSLEVDVERLTTLFTALQYSKEVSPFKCTSCILKMTLSHILDRLLV